ncbi:hypothetical protein QYE76_010171 [Lolium multiflorum]|uniref:BTB domain-containing protein n=1 Tax=Lolium multiflorum TaxID=4521 RepID=A0AAD8TWQ4_LOLMU|nr:hypothetical protein QYE76_010171 [Lolium multiflorum]
MTKNYCTTIIKIVAHTPSGYHVLKIQGYSGSKFLSEGPSIKSPLSPQLATAGASNTTPSGKARFYQACISLYLVLEEDVASPVKSLVQFGFAAEERRHLVPFFPKKSKTPSPLFKSSELDFISRGAKGCDQFIERSTLHLGNLLTAGKGADMVFEVGGEMLATHRWLLAARSPVFAAELFGSMSESGGASGVRVADMEGRVFRALLRFVYTYS